MGITVDRGSRTGPNKFSTSLSSSELLNKLEEEDGPDEGNDSRADGTPNSS